MAQVCSDTDFAQKPVCAQGRGEFGSQHLHRHFAFVLEVFGEVHGGHAARTEFFLDGVEVGKGGREPGGDVGHGP